MPYAADTDFSARFGAAELLQLTDRDGDGIADAGVFDDAAADASAEIDGYLAVRYALPLSTVPPILVRVCCDIARYRLYANHASEEVSNRYTEAVKWLTNVSNGIVQLGLDPPPAPGGNDPQPLYEASPRVITRCRTRDYTEPSDPFNWGGY